MLEGPLPVYLLAATERDEGQNVAAWLQGRIAEGVAPHELGVIVRSATEVPRAEAAVIAAGLRGVVLDDRGEPESHAVAITTMHLAKGLEFKAVAAMACDDEIVPLQVRIDAITDEADLEDVYTTERHLLYVACTRARDQLLVSAVRPGSEFLRDMQPAAPRAGR